MAIDIFAGNDNIFLTGRAGTGKTYNLNKFIESHKNVLVTAPTGVAAVNCGGTTMHKAFGIPVPAAGGKLPKKTSRNVKMVAKSDIVIIDEVSMCRSDVFDYAVKVIRLAESVKGKKIRMIVCGDFLQLPPVVRPEEKQLLRDFGFDDTGYAFLTEAWRDMKFKIVNLEKIYRQDNPEFIENLELARNADPACIDYFNRFVLSKDNIEPDTINICGTNATALEINKRYMEGLPGEPVTYKAKTKGTWQKDIVDEEITLKPGALVMFIVNDVTGSRYQNGSIGTVESLHKDHLTVKVGQNTVKVLPHEFISYEYKVEKGSLKKNEIGSVIQIPLKIGKAVTIHKSQGKTFDSAIISPQIFAPCQLYVALSRVKDPSGLFLRAPLKASDLITDPVLDGFQKSILKQVPAGAPMALWVRCTDITDWREKTKPFMEVLMKYSSTNNGNDPVYVYVQSEHAVKKLSGTIDAQNIYFLEEVYRIFGRENIKMLQESAASSQARLEAADRVKDLIYSLSEKYSLPNANVISFVNDAVKDMKSKI